MDEAGLWADLGAHFGTGFVEIDEVFVPAGDWTQAKLGNPSAIRRLQNMFHGMTLYEHAFSVPADWVKVTLRDLSAAGVIKSIVLSKSP